MNELVVYPIALHNEIRPGDPLPELISQQLVRRSLGWQDGDVLVVAQKAVSKAEGRIVALDRVEPSEKALDWAGRYGKDPRMIEVVLQQARRIVRMERGVLIAETEHGFICANCGVDQSNTAPGTVALLPEDPDRSADRICRFVRERHGAEIACLISDSFGRPWREGLVSVALGVAGLQPVIDLRGQPDRSGRKLTSTLQAVGDELAAAAGLMMGKADGVPAVLIRGYRFRPADGCGRDLLRPPEHDLFP